jgi:hypothetical protein
MGRRSEYDEDRVPSSNHRQRVPHDVPFKDADEELGEIPLAMLDSFIVHARDEKGQQVPVHLHMPPYMERQIQIILRSQRFPYTRASDFLRHAANRHIQWCVGIRQSIPKSMVPALEAILEVCRDNELRMSVENALERIELQVQAHIQEGEMAEAYRLLALVRSKLDGVQDSTKLRKFKRELDAKYGHLDRAMETTTGVKSRRLSGEEMDGDGKGLQ